VLRVFLSHGQEEATNVVANTASSPDTKMTVHALIEQMHVHGWTWRTTGAIFGLGGGIIAPLAGSILTAIAWFSGPLWHGFALHRDGTILLFLTIPLLLFGAHCLDLIDKHTYGVGKAPRSINDNRSNFKKGKTNEVVTD
jgi:hypothetical protein